MDIDKQLIAAVRAPAANGSYRAMKTLQAHSA